MDPLGDQTYYFTAARCASDFDKGVVAIGTSPRGSRIWVGSSRSWDEFVNPVTAILKHLEATIKPVDAPIPVVAVSSIDTTKIDDAFDLGIIPPELLSDETNEQAREEMEQWAYHSHFRILKKSHANFSAEVALNGTILGTIEFEMDLRDAENVKWRLESRAATDETEELLEIEKALQNKRKRCVAFKPPFGTNQKFKYRVSTKAQKISLVGLIERLRNYTFHSEILKAGPPVSI